MESAGFVPFLEELEINPILKEFVTRPTVHMHLDELVDLINAYANSFINA
jgi:hypothetical protein